MPAGEEEIRLATQGPSGSRVTEVSKKKHLAGLQRDPAGPSFPVASELKEGRPAGSAVQAVRARGVPGPVAGTQFAADAGEDDETHDPLEPKVMAPHYRGQGKTPRKVEIERKKRLFAAQDITLLLLKEGIDDSEPKEVRDARTAFPTYLPLEAFDNTDFEGRSPAQWVGLGMVGDTMVAVPAKALKINPDGSGVWTPCRMLGY